jgi:hypothetical protein
MLQCSALQCNENGLCCIARARGAAMRIVTPYADSVGYNHWFTNASSRCTGNYYTEMNLPALQKPHGKPRQLHAVSASNKVLLWLMHHTMLLCRYGNWDGNSAATIIPKFLSNLGNTLWWNISTTYYNSANTKIPSMVYYGGSVSAHAQLH